MDWKRDLVREDIFNNEYHIKPEVYVRYELNNDNTFKVFELKFVFKDKEYYLIEHYAENTNLTAYCILSEHNDCFNRFVDAEHKLVEMMKNGSS